MKLRKPFDIARFTPFDRRMLYMRVIFWVFLLNLSLEILTLSLSYSIILHSGMTITQVIAIIIGLGCLVSTLITIVIIGILHWYLLVRIDGENTQERHQLLVDLFDAIEKNQLEIYFQSQINLSTEEIVGMEALVRWNHPIKGLINPNDFIPLAEETGLIIQIGHWVLVHGCKQNKEWLDMGYNLRLAINLSPVQLHAEIVDEILQILADTNYPPEKLELEITETGLIENMDEAISVMAKLKAIGIQVSMDDFGTGYSSLAHLDKFAIKKIKIDKAFVHQISPYDEEPNIADSIIRMGHNLGLIILAEGIETAYQKDYFKALGCDEGQGYLFGAPVPAKEFIKTIKR